jgi:hypothetical protein
MPFDNKAAENFIGSAARSLYRRRYSMLFADRSVEPVIEAPRGYRSPDGGFGHGLEPDLRCLSSQPTPTLCALEILGEAGAASESGDRHPPNQSDQGSNAIAAGLRNPLSLSEQWANEEVA